jgi:hypothetical protein
MSYQLPLALACGIDSGKGERLEPNLENNFPFRLWPNPFGQSRKFIGKLNPPAEASGNC